MPDIPIATGSVLFKGDMSQYERDIEIAEEKLQKLNKGLQDGSLKMAAYAAKGINTEMEKAAKATKRMMDEVRLGKMGVLMRDVGDMGKRFQQRMQQFGTVGMGVGASAIGAASVASPLAADTLTGSFKLLTASIGRDFVPLVKDLSYTLQMAAEKWRNLDGAVKENIVSMVKMTAVAGTAALAVSGIMKALSFLAANPLVLAGAGVGLAAAAGENRLERQRTQVQEVKDAINATSEKEAATGWQRSNLEAMKPEDAKRESIALFEAKRQEYNKAVMQHTESSTGFRGLANSFKGNTEEEDALKKVLITGREFAEARINAKKFAGIDMPGGEQSADKKPNMLMGATGPSSYSSLNDFYRSMNLETTSGSQLEAKIKQEQIQADMEFRNASLQTLKEIAANTGKSH